MRVERRNSSEDPDPAFTWSDQRAQITSHPARIDWYLMTLHCPSCGSAALVLRVPRIVRGGERCQRDDRRKGYGRTRAYPAGKERGIPGTALG